MKSKASIIAFGQNANKWRSETVRNISRRIHFASLGITRSKHLSLSSQIKCLHISLFLEYRSDCHPAVLAMALCCFE
jgi:hypothetical protein